MFDFLASKILACREPKYSKNLFVAQVEKIDAKKGTIVCLAQMGFFLTMSVVSLLFQLSLLGSRMQNNELKVTEACIGSPNFKSLLEFLTCGTLAFSCQVVEALLHLTRLSFARHMPGGPSPNAAAIRRCQSLESCRPSLSGAVPRRVAAFVKGTVSDSSSQHPFIDKPAAAIAPNTPTSVF